MNWNRDEVSQLLRANITDEALADGGHVTVVQFEDARMRYDLRDFFMTPALAVRRYGRRFDSIVQVEP